MTTANLPLIEILLNGGGGDFLRQVLARGLQGFMESDVQSHTNASLHEHSTERTVHRNVYRNRPLDTPMGTIDLAIPKLRKGSYFPAFLEPGKRIDTALLSVIQEAYRQCP
jgi:putative transposase